MLRRLLMATGGRGSFTPFVSFTIPAPNAGGWTEVTGPHAHYDGAGRTFITWVGGNSKPNDIEVAAYLHAGGAIEGPVLLHDHLTDGSSTDPDSHNGGTVIILSDGTILVAYCGHQATLMRTKRSNIPAGSGWAAAGFTTASAFSHTGVTWTYPRLAQLSAASDRVYINMRGQITSGTIGGYWQNYSDDGGVTWGSEFELYRPLSGPPLVYSAMGSNGVDRIDYAVTDYASDHVGGYGLWHFYMDEAGDYFLSDGTPIAGSLPLHEADLTQLVATGGDSYPYSVGYTADGRPVIACQSKNADPVEIFEYRWTGSAWVRNDITTSDPISPSILSVGGGMHVWDDADRFITSRFVSELIVSEYRTADDGATWTHFADYGSGSSPVYVREGSGLVSLWFAPASSFVTSDDFDPGLAGVG